MTAGFNREYQEFRCLVGMHLAQAGLKGRQLIERSLDQQHRLVRRFNLVVPAIDGMDGRQQGGTSGQPFVNKRAANTVGFFRTNNGGHNDASGRGRFEHKSLQYENEYANTLRRFWLRVAQSILK